MNTTMSWSRVNGFLRQWSGVAVGVLLLSPTVSAANFAHDNAADPAYNSGWAGGDFSGAGGSNGGSGWSTPWIGGGIGGSLFVGSSATNGSGDPEGDGDINTPRTPQGRAWGMKLDGTSSGQVSQIGLIRSMIGTLTSGQTLKIDMDNGTLGPDRHEGWGLNSYNATAFGFFADTNPGISHGKSDYFIFDNDGYRDTGIPFTDQGVHCEFTLLDDRGNYRLTVTPMSAGATVTTLTGHYTDTFQLDPPNGPIIHQLTPIHDFQLEDVNQAISSTPDGVADYLYFNNIEIVPEPVSVFPLTLAAGLLNRRRR